MNFLISLFVFFQLAPCATGPEKILTAKELKKGERFNETSLSRNKNKPDYFWVCEANPKRHLTAKCEDLGINELEGPKAELVLSVKSGKYLHEYGLRHAITANECASYLRGIRRMKKANKDFCIFGSTTGPENDGKTFGWVFFEIKSNFRHVVDFDWDPDE